MCFPPPYPSAGTEKEGGGARKWRMYLGRHSLSTFFFSKRLVSLCKQPLLSTQKGAYLGHETSKKTHHHAFPFPLAGLGMPRIYNNYIFVNNE